MITFVIAGLLLGVAGSMHCVGMCGPLVSAVPVRGSSRSSRLVDRAVYHGARTGTYTAMGAVIGLGAGVFDLAGYGQLLSIAAGAMMVLLALAQILWHKQILPQAAVNRVTGPLRRIALRFTGQQHRGGMVLLGAVNGLLPCGLVTSALVGSAAGGDAIGGALFMCAFGVGTSPALLAISFGATELRKRLGSPVGVVLPLLALFLGGLIMLRGMNLGVPYVSPAITHAHTQAACCSGK